MPDCFISYSSQDKQLATFVHSELLRLGVTAFMASASLQPGQHWSADILNNLRGSNWVILLASRAACASAFVNQEVGGALVASKHLVPIVWDMSPGDLPGWARSIQAIDLRGSTMVDLQNQVAAIAARIKQEKAQGLLIVGAVILGLFALAKGG
jgi:TIR domain